MASLRELAKDNIYEAALGVCWFALWKTGRTWHMEDFYPEYDEKKDLFRITDEDRDRLQEILSEDHGAKFINGYYCNIGTMEEMTVKSLAGGLAFQYETGHVMLSDIL